MSGIAITFPSSPTEGQSYLAQNGFTYIYDSLKNRWKRGGEFVRSPKVLSYAGVAATTVGSGVTTGPTGALIYRVPGFVVPNSEVGVDSYKAYRAAESYPNYTEVQVSISSAFSTIAYAATFTGTTHTVPANTLSGDTTYYLRARQFVGSSAASAGVGAISGYSQNIVSFATTSTFIDTPVIVSIAGTTQFPVYNIGFAATTLAATVRYQGSGVGNLEKVEWRVTGPRNPDSTGDVALAEVGIGTHSSVTLANALVLAMPFSGATGVGITDDVNNAIRTASGASAGTTKTVTAVGGISTTNIGTAQTAHYYSSAAFFDAVNDYLTTSVSSDFNISTGNWTAEFWDYTISAGNRTYLHFNSGGSGGLHIWRNSSNQLVIDDGLTGQSAILSNLSLNRWTHYAFVRIPNTIYVYVDGVLLATSSVSPQSSDRITIGNYISVSYFKSGYIQDLKIYKGLAKYQENFTPPLPTYGTISYTTRTIGSVGVATTAFFESTGDIPTAEASSTAANALVLAMPMNRTFGFQDINVAIRGLTSGASAGTAKTVGLGTTSTANAPTHPIISSTESKWYDGAAYFYNGRYALLPSSSDYAFGTGDYTIEGWFYRGGTTGGSSTYRVWFGTQNIGTPVTGFLVFDTGGTLYYYQADNTAALTTTNIPPLNTWNHLAITRSGTSLRMFINGVLIASATSSVNHSASNSVFIGGDTSGSYYFEGYMQDLKLYKGFAKYTANFTPPQPICGFTTDLAIQTGFTTTSATGVALTSIVGLGSTSTLAFAADLNLTGITSITSSSGITTLPDPYAQNLVLALPLANITGVGNSFTNDRNTQIRSISITGAGVTAGVTKTITNSGVTTVSAASTIGKGYNNNIAYFNGSSFLSSSTNTDFAFGPTTNFTVECWVYPNLVSGAQILFDTRIGGTSGAGFAFYLSSSSLAIYTSTSNIAITASGTIVANAWQHVSVVRDGSQIRLYINGVLQATSTNSNDFSNGNCVIGRTNESASNYVNGYIQDLKVYNGLAKYTTNFTPPPPMFGDYTRSTPNKIVFTPGSDYVLEARNTATGGIVTSVYSATRQWGTKPKGGIYDPYASNLVLAIPGGAVGGATTTFDVTGQIRYESPTPTYANAGIVTYSNSYGVGTYTNRSVSNVGVALSTTVSRYYSRSMYFNGAPAYLDISGSNDFNFPGNFTIECWVYKTSSGSLDTLFEIGLYTNGILVRPNSATTIEMWINNTQYSTSIPIPTNGQWFHYALVRNDGTIVTYINGISAHRLTLNSTINSASDALRIGQSRHTGGTQSITGFVNDFRIYKGVAKYTSNFTPPNQIYLT